MHRLANWSLRTHILTMVVILVVPMLALAAYTFATIRQASAEDVREQLAIQTDAVAARIDYVISSAVNVADVLRAADVTDEGCQGLLDRLRSNYDRYNVIAMGNRQGDVLCSSPQQTPLPNVADRDWFQTVIATDSMTIGSFQTSRITDEANIIVAAPVQLDNGSQLSIVGVGIRLSWLSEFIASLGLPEGAVFGVIDQNERFLVRYPNHLEWVGSPVGDSTAQALLKSGMDTAITLTARDGVRRHYVGSWRPFDGARYFVYSGLPVATFTELARRVTFMQISLIVLVGLLLAIIAMRLARGYVVEPITQAKAFARTVASGNFGERIAPENATRELRELTDSLNTMAETLAHTSRDMAKASQLARLGVWRIGISDGSMVWSDEIYDIFGVDPTAFAPTLEAASERVHPDDRDRFLRLLRDVVREPGPYTLQFRLIRSDGVRHCRIEGDGVVSHDRDGTWLLGMCQDVTALRRLERERDESTERFRYVARATADAIWDWNLTDDTVWWSSGMQALFGHSPEEIEPDSRSWTERIHPEDQDRVVARIREVIAGEGTGWENTYRFRRRDGSYAIVDDRGFVIRNGDGRAVRMVGGMTDVTERTRLEDHVRKSQRLESIGQLTGGIAHDFNNLLTVMMGNAEVLDARLRDVAPELAPTAEMITAAARRGAALTQQLLAFARKQPLEPTAVDVNHLVEDMIDLMRRTLGEHIEIELILQPETWTALVDPTQLESALLNLCLNARDAMPAGGRLTIETKNVHLDEAYTDMRFEIEPGRYVQVAVSDTGVGIAPKDLERVFEPFFTTKQGHSTGLGLSMVYGFVKQSNGHIAVYSEPGEGTTVRMHLPRIEGGVVAAGRNEVQAEVGGGGERILVVEDDPLVRDYVEVQLVDLGYRVHMAEDAKSALEILRERDDIDLLFTDVVMPGGMNGRQLADAATQLRSDLRVLYTSGYTESAIVHHGRLDSGVHLLSKPYRPSDLARKVREALTTP